MITTEDAEKAVDWLRNNAKQIGQARAARIYTEHWIKTVKANLQLENIEREDISVSAAEILALSSPRYFEALQALRDAVKEDETLRFLAVAAEAKLECWRSQESTRRAEGKAYS